MSSRDLDIDVPDTSAIRNYERLATQARKNGDTDRAEALYENVLTETRQYLSEVENIRCSRNLGPGEEDYLEEIEADLTQLERSIENELDRL